MRDDRRLAYITKPAKLITAAHQKELVEAPETRRKVHEIIARFSVIRAECKHTLRLEQFSIYLHSYNHTTYAITWLRAKMTRVNTLYNTITDARS